MMENGYAVDFIHGALETADDFDQLLKKFCELIGKPPNHHDLVPPQLCAFCHNILVNAVTGLVLLWPLLYWDVFYSLKFKITSKKSVVATLTVQNAWRSAKIAGAVPLLISADLGNFSFVKFSTIEKKIGEILLYRTRCSSSFPLMQSLFCTLMSSKK